MLNTFLKEGKMKSNQIDEYASSGTSPTARARVSKNKNKVVPLDVNSPIDPSQILTLRELAERLKVSERWVYEKSRRRYLNPFPTIRIGRYLRFDWVEVSAWLRQQSGSAA
jgi:predicted DNA-binding transcriptional regulator AlpA